MDRDKKEKILEYVVIDYFKGINLPDAIESAIERVENEQKAK